MIFRIFIFSLALTVTSLAQAGRSCKREHLKVTPVIYDQFLAEASEYLIDHLRWPSEDESQKILIDVLGKLKSEAEPSLKEVLSFSKDGLLNDFREKRMERYLYLRRKIATAFVTAVRQTRLEPRFRTVPRTPSLKLLFLSLIAAKSNGGPQLLADYMRGQFNVENLEALMTEKETLDSLFPAPLLFPGGMKEIEDIARLDSPATFKSYQDTKLLTPERAQKTIEAIEKARGFVAVSWTSGKPIDEGFLHELLNYVEERDFVLLVGPTQQIYEGIPEILLNHPRIHIVTNAIENRFLKLSNLPINPNLENPLQAVNKPGQFRIGQTVVFFHPHTMIASVPTDSNTYAPTTLITTGSINVPFGSFSGVSQGSRATTAKNFHKRRAVVFEKGDRESGMDPDGLQNVWHYRPISYFDDVATNGTRGFIDWGEAYLEHAQPDGSFKSERSQIYPEYIYLGDPHEAISDPRFVHALGTALGIPADQHFTIIGGDLFDGDRIKHWDFDKQITLNQKFESNALDLQQEINGVIQYVNAIQQRYPNARFMQIIGNHDEWLKRLLDHPPDFQRVINGTLIDELAFAVKTLNMNVWEYLFKRRTQFLTTLLDIAPEKRKEILSRIVPIHDVNRIDILDRGEPLIVGPEHRQNVLHRHGDERVNGRRATAKDLMLGAQGGVSGHNHLMLMFDEWGSAGVSASVEQDYTKGSLSSQGQGFWFIYGNGTKQMVTFDRLSGTLRQKPGGQILEAPQFFGEDQLNIIPNDNDLVPKDEAEKWIENQLEILKGKP